MLKPLHHLKPKTGKEIPFIILISFLVTFLVSRLVVFYGPTSNFYLNVKGIHVHHLAYGICLLGIVGFLSLVLDRTEKVRLRLSVWYGIALGLAFDEFAMWIQLEDVYRDRSTYDAIMIITLIMLNVVYFSDFWKKWHNRLGSLLHKLTS